MGVLERLTYLLGICVAAITWSVTQLNTAVTSDEVIGYGVVTTTYTDHTKTIAITITNLSRVHTPANITISMYEDRQGCISSFLYTPELIAIPISANAAVDPGRKGFESISVPLLPPGGSVVMQTTYKLPCTVLPMIDLSASAGEHPGLVKVGLETWVLRHQFLIYLTLISTFAGVFGITFVASIVMVPKPVTSN